MQFAARPELFCGIKSTSAYWHSLFLRYYSWVCSGRDIFSYVVMWFEMGKQEFKMAAKVYAADNI